MIFVKQQTGNDFYLINRQDVILRLQILIVKITLPPTLLSLNYFHPRKIPSNYHQTDYASISFLHLRSLSIGCR